MTGYVVAPRTFKLTFPDREGLEVRMRSVSIAKAEEMRGWMNSRGEDGDIHLLQIFGEHLIEWNVQEEVKDEEGKPTGERRPVPATYEGARTQDSHFIWECVFNWWLAMVGVSEGKATKSDSGQSSPPLEELSIPMEVLSGNP